MERSKYSRDLHITVKRNNKFYCHLAFLSAGLSSALADTAGSDLRKQEPVPRIQRREPPLLPRPRVLLLLGYDGCAMASYTVNRPML